MKKIRPANLSAMLLGLLILAYGISGFIRAKSYEEYLPAIGIGILLFVLAYLNSRKRKPKGLQ